MFSSSSVLNLIAKAALERYTRPPGHPTLFHRRPEVVMTLIFCPGDPLPNSAILRWLLS
jgi:hypothetical protein